jgi:endonuclease G
MKTSKTLIIGLLLTSTTLFATSVNLTLNETMASIVKEFKNNQNGSYGSLTKIQKDRSFARIYINNQKCDRVIKNQVVTSCYSDELSSITKVAYVIDGSNVHQLNLEKRPDWTTNNKIPYKFRSTEYDYVHTGYDKGHLAPDSAFDFKRSVLENTYDLNINAIPMAAKVNRYTWIKAERYSKNVAKKLGYVQVIDFPVFSKYPKTLKNSNVAIAKGFFKILINKQHHFQKCFYYDNVKNVNVKNDKLNSHIVSCNKVFNLLKY